MCEDIDNLDYEEDNALYYEYGEGFERELEVEGDIKPNYEDEPLDPTILNSRKVRKDQLDDYFLGFIE